MAWTLATARACAEVGGGLCSETLCARVASDGGFEVLAGACACPAADATDDSCGSDSSGSLDKDRMWSRMSTERGIPSAERISLNM